MYFDAFDFAKKMNDKAESLKRKADKYETDMKRPFTFEYINAYTCYCQAFIDLCTDKQDKDYLETESKRQLMIITDHVENAARRYDLKTARSHLKTLAGEFARIDYLLRVVSDDDLLKLEDSTRCPVPDDWEGCIDNCIADLCRKYSISIPKAGE